jgi:hypothetical protein
MRIRLYPYFYEKYDIREAFLPVKTIFCKLNKDVVWQRFYCPNESIWIISMKGILLYGPLDVRCEEIEDPKIIQPTEMQSAGSRISTYAA